MMPTKFQEFGAYKSIGIEYLDKIPKHWLISRIKEIGSVNGRVGWKALKASEYVDEGYAFLSTPNIKHKEIDFDNVNYITYERYIESPEIRLKVDDILLTKDGSTLGTVNIVHKLPKPTTVNSSIAVLRFNKHIFNKYLFYQIASNYIQNKIALKKSGMGVPHLFQQDINNFAILLPPLPEQTAIANYLDEKTALIDKKITLLTQKADKYKELKQALINETVTKGLPANLNGGGLDKNVKLKDSGVECLSAVEEIGKIPEHWEVKRLKELGIIETSSVDKKVKDDETSIKLVNYTDVYGNKSKEIWTDTASMVVSATSEQIRSKNLKQGDIVFTPSSETIDEIGIAAVIMENLPNTLYSYHILRLRFNKIVDLHFKKYLFNNGYVQFYFSKSSKGSTRKILGLSAFNNLLVALPPLVEQTQIAEYLDKKTSQIDKIVESINNQIDKLKELRKTLINDVVTGKIKVTNDEAV